MYATISHTTAYAKTLLNQHSFGNVHSVYKKTINLSLGGLLLSLQIKHSPLSPLSLITELDAFELERIQVLPGQSFSIQNSQIQLSSCCFSFSASQIHNTKLSDILSPLSISDLYQEMKRALTIGASVGFQPLFIDSLDISHSPILFTAQKCMSTCKNSYSNSYNSAAESLVALLGLGIGLTPSGDDFLCGVLAGLQLLGWYDHPFSGYLRTQIKAHLDDTNDISAAFLTCALQNQYSVAVQILATSPLADKIAVAFGEIGHSSGIDTLCGVLYAFQLCMK